MIIPFFDSGFQALELLLDAHYQHESPAHISREFSLSTVSLYFTEWGFPGHFDHYLFLE
jgi:hypothetical protein